MTSRAFDIDPPNIDTDGICENQTTAGAANLVLNGALCDLGTAAQFDIGDSYPEAIKGVRFSFDSAGNISTVNFTITGLDQYGNSATEVVTGVTTTAVNTVGYWSQVTQIAADAAVSSNVFVGTVSEFVSVCVPINWQSLEAYQTACVGIDGTIAFDFQQTYDQVRTATPVYWNTYQSGSVTSGADASVTYPASRHAVAVRLVVTSYSSGAELQYQVVGQ